MESALRLLKLSRRTMVIAVQNKGSSNLLKLNTTDSPLIIGSEPDMQPIFTMTSTLVQVH